MGFNVMMGIALQRIVAIILSYILNRLNMMNCRDAVLFSVTRAYPR